MSDREEDRLVIAGAIQLAHKYLSDENAKVRSILKADANLLSRHQKINYAHLLLFKKSHTHGFSKASWHLDMPTHAV